MDKKSYKFSKEHEWVKIENGEAFVGLSDYAQKELGDVVFVELPEVDVTISKGDTCSTVESVKAVSDVYSPLSGEVVEVNEALEDDPSLVNKAPLTDGWIYKIKIDDDSELEELMSFEDYEKFLADL